MSHQVTQVRQPADLGCPWIKAEAQGDRAFAVVGPNLWNELPPDVLETLPVFKSCLKTHFYILAFSSV